MQNRLKHFRAGLLLVLSSALSFSIISYWFPLNTYLSAIASDKYDDYRVTIQLFVASFLIFFLLNLVTAVLCFTRIPSSYKFYLALIPAVVIVILPFLLAIPIAIKFPDRNYFEILQAMYRLFRFTKIGLFVLAIVITVVCAAINVLAALIVLRAGAIDKVDRKLQTRYMIYGGITLVLLAGSMGINYYNSFIRSVDRASCYDYRDLQLPFTDEEIPIFLNEIQVFGDQAGSATLKNAFYTFATTSRQYYTVLNSEADAAMVSQFEIAVATAKQTVTDLCSEFATD